MGYALGIDLGTTYSAAAVCRDGGPVEVCTLGTTSQSIPTVVVLREDGEILTGEAAERRAPSEPTRTAREFKRRLGDPVPLIIGSTPYGAEALMGFVLRDIVAQVTQREGSAPDTIVLTHPANYSDYKLGLLHEAARLAGLDLGRVQFLSEPQAAAVSYAGQRRVEPGVIVAVYDFGGGTFDAAVVRADEGLAFTLLGSPEGMERLGGIDVDQAVLAHVDQAVDGMVTTTGTADPAGRTAVVRLREEVRRAKEALSEDTDATISVALPGLQTEVRLTREELEAMIRPRVVETVEALRRAVASAGVPMEDVSRVLLVGGSSRIPLVGLLVRELTGRPVAVDAHPKLAIASGAAVVGAAAAPAAEEVTATEVLPTATPENKGRRRAAAGAVAGAAAGAAVLAGGESSAAASTPAAVAGVGPVGIPTTAGPVGTPSAAAVSASAPNVGSTAAKAARHVPVKAIAAAAVAAVVAVGAGAVLSSQGTKKNPTPVAAGSSHSATPAVTPGATSSSTLSSSAPSVDSTAGRGLTNIATILAGLPSDNSGKGVPGAATSVSLGTPSFTAVGPDGAVYVVDDQGGRLLRIKNGQATVAYQSDASHHVVGGVAVSPIGKVVLLTLNGLVEVTGDGQSTPIATLAELGDGVGPGGQTPLAFDGAGNLYLGISNRYKVLRRAVDGTMTVVAGNGAFAGGTATGDGSAATGAPLTAMEAILVDPKGNLLIGQNGGVLRQVAPDGTLSTLSGRGKTPLADSQSRFAPDGTKLADLGFRDISALAFDAKGRLYIGDTQSNAIVRINSDDTMTLLAADQSGTANPSATARPANQTRFVSVDGLAFDRTGALLVSESGLVIQIADAAA